MKYFTKGNDVYAFEADGSQDGYITEDMIAMTAEEIDRYMNPQDYMSAEEQRAAYLASLRPLTRRQFKLTLLENDLLDGIETAIGNIEDDYLRAKMQIEYTEALEFSRTSASVLYICNMLELTDEQVDTMWEFAMQIPI